MVLPVRHSFTTRLLFSLLPSTWYAKNDVSLEGLLNAMSDDLVRLFENGILCQVPWYDQHLLSFHLLFVYSSLEKGLSMLATNWSGGRGKKKVQPGAAGHQG